MPVRPSMVELVSRLRSSTGAATDDEFHGVTYWSDEQLQTELDLVKTPLWAGKLVAVPRKIDGSTIYSNQVFQIPRGYWLEDDFTIRDENGNEITTPTYSVTHNELMGFVTFTSDPGSGQLYIDAYLYDWNAAAASVWGQKADHRFDYINIKAGDHKFDARQEYEHCVDRAAWHAARKVKSFRRNPGRFVPESQNEGSRR
jgi:hypothetical protein